MNSTNQTRHNIKILKYSATIHSFRINSKDYDDVNNEKIHSLQWKVSFDSDTDLYFTSESSDRKSLFTLIADCNSENGYYNFEWNQMIQFVRTISKESKSFNKTILKFELMSKLNVLGIVTCELDDLSMIHESPKHKRLLVYLPSDITGILSLTITTEVQELDNLDSPLAKTTLKNYQDVSSASQDKWTNDKNRDSPLNQRKIVQKTVTHDIDDEHKKINNHEKVIDNQISNHKSNSYHTSFDRYDLRIEHEDPQTQYEVNTTPTRYSSSEPSPSGSDGSKLETDIRQNSQSIHSTPTNYNKHYTFIPNVESSHSLYNSSPRSSLSNSGSIFDAQEETSRNLTPVNPSQNISPKYSSLTTSPYSTPIATPLSTPIRDINPFDIEQSNEEFNQIPKPQDQEIFIHSLQKKIQEQDAIINSITKMNEILKQLKQKHLQIIDELNAKNLESINDLDKEKQSLAETKTLLSKIENEKLILIQGIKQLSNALKELKLEKEIIKNQLKDDQQAKEQELTGYSEQILTLMDSLISNLDIIEQIEALEIKLNDMKIHSKSTEEKLQQSELISAKKDDILRLFEEKLKISEAEVESLQQLIHEQEELKLIDMEKLEEEIQNKIEEMKSHESQIKEQLETLTIKENLVRNLELEADNKLQALKEITELSIKSQENNQNNQDIQKDLEEQYKIKNDQLENKENELANKEEEITNKLLLLQEKEKLFEEEHTKLSAMLLDKLSKVEEFSKSLEEKEIDLQKQFQFLKEKMILVEAKEKEISISNNTSNIESVNKLSTLSAELEQYRQSLQDKEDYLKNEEQRIQEKEIQLFALVKSLQVEYTRLQEREEIIQNDKEKCEETIVFIKNELENIQSKKEELADQEQALEVETTLSRKEILLKTKELEEKENELAELEFALNMKEEEFSELDSLQKCKSLQLSIQIDKSEVSIQTEHQITLTEEDFHELVETEIEKVKQEYQETIEVLEEEMQATTKSLTEALEEKDIQLSKLAESHRSLLELNETSSSQPTDSIFEGNPNNYENSTFQVNEMDSNDNTENNEDIEYSESNDYNDNFENNKDNEYSESNEDNENSLHNILFSSDEKPIIEKPNMNIGNKYQSSQLELNELNSLNGVNEFSKLETLSQIHDYLENETSTNVDSIDILVTKTQILKMRVEDQLQRIDLNHSIRNELSLIMKSLESLTEEFTTQKDQIITERSSLLDKSKKLQNASLHIQSNSQSHNDNSLDQLSLNQRSTNSNIIHETNNNTIDTLNTNNVKNNTDQSQFNRNPYMYSESSSEFGDNDPYFNSYLRSDTESNDSYFQSQSRLPIVTETYIPNGGHSNLNFNQNMNRYSNHYEGNYDKEQTANHMNHIHNSNYTILSPKYNAVSNDTLSQTLSRNSLIISPKNSSKNSPKGQQNFRNDLQLREATIKQIKLDSTRKDYIKKTLHIDFTSSPKRL